MLAVIDLESNKPVEEYVYDPSGNILKKTISGKITTYTYDSANQLVSSVAPDGKITNYAYDAAGRMIKEGNKTYEYGWLDKVLKVTENGKTLADFEYHNNGQIAKAIRPDKTENFLWDGLALVKRDDTKFINEPHAGGGNPVLAIQDVDADKSKAIFTDMLGTSLGSSVEDQYNNITKTSFGADSSDTSAFFTGKPYINELGYAFLLRNYRADTGKWLSQDLIGYPDGWNNLTYCGNSTNIVVDLFGAYMVARKNESYGTIIKSEFLGTRKISEDDTSITYEDTYKVYWVEKYDHYNVEKASDLLSNIESGAYAISVTAGGVASIAYVAGGAVVATIVGVTGGVAGVIGYLSELANADIETYMYSREVKTDKGIFTETRIEYKQQEDSEQKE